MAECVCSSTGECKCSEKIEFPEMVFDLETVVNKAVADTSIKYKYAEDFILADLKKHLDKSYEMHYTNEESNIECFDAWIALGDSGPTFRNTAMKYLWRYGKKEGNNPKDLLKAMHYIFMLYYVDNYRKN